MSIEGDLLFPQPDYFSELNHENVAFDEADFEKDIFGPATSGLSEHSQAPDGGHYGSLVSDPLNLGEDHFLHNLGHHEELEVESKSSHSGGSNAESNPRGGAGAKQETPPFYGNGMVPMGSGPMGSGPMGSGPMGSGPMSSGPMFQYPGMGGYIQQDAAPHSSAAAATADQFDRLALESQHMAQYQAQQELLAAQARQLQAQQAQLASLQQAQFLYAAQGQPPQPIMFLPPRTGAPPVMYAVPHPVQLQPLPGGMAYHSAVAPVPVDQALNGGGKYYTTMPPPGATPLQMSPTPVHLNPTSMQLNPPPLQPLHVTAPVSPRVSGPMTPRSPHPRVKTEEGVASPGVRHGGRTFSGGDANSGRASPPGDKKPPRSPTIPDQHTRPPLPTMHAVYMPVQYIQGGGPSFPRVASEDLLAQVDANGDVLRPLPPMPQRGGHGMSALQRSQSSHSLGQLQMGGAAPAPADGTGMQRLDTSAPYQIPNQGLGGMPVRQSNAMGAAGMRRVQSTGDIQSWNRPAQNGDAAAHYDDFKVGRYTLEERKMRIQRYRQKRNERNYNKKIKYVCRKTLADSRPRIRGRFAKNDEVPGLAEAKKALEEEDDSSDFDEDMIIEGGGTDLLGSADFDILEAERSIASLASAPATFSA